MYLLKYSDSKTQTKSLVLDIFLHKKMDASIFRVSTVCLSKFLFYIQSTLPHQTCLENLDSLLYLTNFSEKYSRRKRSISRVECTPKCYMKNWPQISDIFKPYLELSQVPAIPWNNLQLVKNNRAKIFILMHPRLATRNRPS